MKLYKLVIAAGLISALVATAAYANTPTTQVFVTKASIANQFEVDSSRLALDKSQNNDVKSFAQHMIDDHTKAGDELKSTLTSSNTKAKEADKLDDKHQKMLDQLKSASGDAFDRQYISMQTDAHKQTVNLFSNYSKHGKNSALKDFASKTLPELQDHLKQVEQLKSKQ